MPLPCSLITDSTVIIPPVCAEVDPYPDFGTPRNKQKDDDSLYDFWLWSLEIICTRQLNTVACSFIRSAAYVTLIIAAELGHRVHFDVRDCASNQRLY